MSTRIAATDVGSVAAHAAAVVEDVRTHGRPHFLVLDTYRLAPHSKGDDLRPEEEIEAHRRADPLAALARDREAVDLDRARRLEHDVETRIAAAVAAAKAAPAPDPERFLVEAARW